MTQYLLSIYQPVEGTPPPDVLKRVMQEIDAIIADARTAGVWVFHGGLQPPAAATVVRHDDGRIRVTDGPFIETKEHLGGFIVIRAASIDAALEWARRLAAATTLPIEVRAFQGRVAG